MTRGGCQWRLLPPDYGCCHAIHQRFRRWSQKGVWQKLFEHCQDYPDLQAIMIDGTIVRAHACAAGYAKDSHALVDALGNPLRFILTPGQRNEITQAEALMKGFNDTVLIADKGYDSNAFVTHLHEIACVPVVPSRRNRKVHRHYDTEEYKESHLIECFFGKIKHYRRVFSRYDKSAASFLSFLHFASVFIWLK